MPKDARALLKFIDEDLGEPIPEKDYGGNCLIYDPDKPADPFHNLWDKVDVSCLFITVIWKKSNILNFNFDYNYDDLQIQFEAFFFF